MTDPRPSPGAGPSVCPFVALAEDRDRRADAPDEGNRCYAERAPRRRDLSHQASYCYSPQFAACSVFLAWAARNAAEPAFVTEAAQRAWGSGITAPEGSSEASTTASRSGSSDDGPVPTPEGGLFGLADPDEAAVARSSEQLDWVSASAWAEVPWDERAEWDAEETEILEDEDEDDDERDEGEADESLELLPEEATQAPKVPAALPMRRRKRAQPPIRSRGSGEWFYADPPGRDPLVKRRYGVTPPILLGVLGLLVVSILVFVLATQLDGGNGRTAAVPSAAPATSIVPQATRPPSATEAPSAEPSAEAEPAIRTYTVKEGDVLSAIAAKRRVDVKLLQCMNRLLDPDVLSPGQVLQIPPEGYVCPPGWRRSTPEPLPGP